MQTLFPIEPVFPDGFSYVPDFISREEEDLLVKEIQKRELKTFLFQGYEAKRKTESFGQDWSFEKGVLSKGKEIPDAFFFLIAKVAKHLSLQTDAFAELLLTEYPPGLSH